MAINTVAILSPGDMAAVPSRTMTILLAALGLFLFSDQPILTAAAMDIVREGTAA